MQAAGSHRVQIISAWHVLLLLLMGTPCQVSCQRVLQIGIDANTWGESMTDNLYNFTFDVYLNEQLRGTSYTFQTVLFKSIDDFVAAGLNRSVDIFFAGPGMFVCLQSRFGLVPLVSLINKYEGRPIYSLGGAAVALASRNDLRTLQDIRNQRITMSGISTLTSGQAQWRELHAQGYNPLLLASQVIFIENQRAQVLAVVNGSADVAFVRADQLSTLDESAKLKVLAPMQFADYPWNTSTRLYPEYSLAADPVAVPLQIRTAIIEALFDINVTHYAAVAGSYYGWNTPYNYLDVYQMQLDTNVLVNGTCLASNDTYEMVVCPPGSYKLPESDIEGLCQQRNLPCLAGAKCYCNFCKLIPRRQFGRLGLAGFLSVLIIGLAILALIIAVIMGANKMTVLHIPFAELNVSDESEVLGEGLYGKVLRGEYRGTQVAVKRMLPPRSSRTKSIFDVEIVRPSRQSQEEVLNMHDSRQLTNDLVIDIMADSIDPPLGSSKSVIYTAAQQFLIAPPEGGKGGPDPTKTLLPIQSAGSDASVMRTSQSMASDTAAVDRDQQAELLLGASVPTTENVAQLQQHQSAAEEDLIRAHPAESPRSTFWGEESRLDVEYDENKRQLERAQYEQARNWQDDWHAFTHALASMWSKLAACILCSPIKHHLTKEAALQQTVVALRLRHPNIVTVMGTSVDPPTRSLLLVTALLERGTLYDLLHNDTVMLENEMILSMLRHVVAGLSFLHSAEPPIMHQELRSLKILLDSSCRAHLSDFQQEVVDMEKMRQRCYPFWVAPEVLQGGAPSTSSDVYALGLVIYEMLYRQEPFNGEDPEGVMAALEQEGPGRGPAKRPQVPGLIDAGLVPLQSLMHHCWHQDPSLRPSLRDVDEELTHLMAEQSAVNDTLAEKRKRDQALLEQMLPPQVAAALREGRAVEPENYDCVTIFFSDIVGFTNISGILQPQEVMDMLDRLYRLFDELTGKYSLFKVETIGDAYMTVGNLRTPQQDHAALVARFAIEAVQAANSVMIRSDDSTSGFLSIRAGLHSGPVVASVVGNMNPRYCLFGDTVNVASRMESSSLQNRIQLSKATAQLLVRQAPDLRRCVARRSGQQAIKGKGFMRTYWLHTKPVDEDALSMGTMASGSRCASQIGVQMGVNRSASVASSGLSNANQANSDASDYDAASGSKEVQASPSSYTDRSKANRVRSTEIIPEFAPVREDSAGEQSDAELCSAVNADSVDPGSYSAKGVADTAGAVTVLPDRKVAELKQGGRNDKSIVSKGVGRTTAHVGFAE